MGYLKNKSFQSQFKKAATSLPKISKALLSHTISLRINYKIDDEIKNLVNEKQNKGNKQASLGGFIREAFSDFKIGLNRDFSTEKLRRQSLTVMVSSKLKDFWNNLPYATRNDMLEHVLNIKLKEIDKINN